MKTKSLTVLIQSFLTDWPRRRGLSSPTVLSYRDTIKLLLCFTVEETGRPVTKLDVPDLTAERVIGFLDYLEQERNNCIATRNNRLMVIRSFFSYVALLEPGWAEHCHRVCAIPLKKEPTRSIPYLELDEMHALLKQPNRKTPDGRRDYALLLFLYNTGARVQELVSVKICDINLHRPRQVLLHGKGKKDRWCPLWEETAQVIMTLLEESKITQQEQAVVFRNHLKKPLSRFGVDYILKKYGRLASVTQPGLKKKRLSPHTIRHTTAVHLLNSGVDINVIRGWLGHVDLATTNIYAEINQTTKMKALERCNPTSSVGNPEPPSWKKQEDILAWLESL